MFSVSRAWVLQLICNCLQHKADLIRVAPGDVGLWNCFWMQSTHCVYIWILPLCAGFNGQYFLFGLIFQASQSRLVPRRWLSRLIHVCLPCRLTFHLLADFHTQRWCPRATECPEMKLSRRKAAVWVSVIAWRVNLCRAMIRVAAEHSCRDLRALFCQTLSVTPVVSFSTFCFDKQSPKGQSRRQEMLSCVCFRLVKKTLAN